MGAVVLAVQVATCSEGVPVFESLGCTLVLAINVSKWQDSRSSISSRRGLFIVGTGRRACMC